MYSILVQIWRSVVGLVSGQSQILKALAAIAADQQRLRGDVAAVRADVATIAATIGQLADELVPGQADRIIFIANLEGNLLIGVETMELRDDQKVDLTIQPVDKKGKPARLDGVPEWASSDETVASLEVAPDGMSATLFGVAPGTARVVVSGDADLGEGVTPITGTLDVTVTAGGAVSITITPGTPVDQ